METPNKGIVGGAHSLEMIYKDALAYSTHYYYWQCQYL